MTSETWGLLIDWIGNDYARRIIDICHQYCHLRRHNLVVFTTGRLGHHADRTTFADVTLPFFTSSGIDRFLLISPQFQAGDGTSLLDRMVTDLRLPVVCYGAPAGGRHHVVNTGMEGFSSLLDHLHHQHGYTRIAWVSGPPSNPDNLARDQALRDWCHNLGLPINPETWIQGDFTRESGRKAAEVLQRKREAWDVVIAANDAMALGLMDVLPPDTPLAGFDNDPQAADRGITSVELDHGHSLYLALEDLGRIGPHSGNARGRVIAKSRFVPGTSCGCVAPSQRPPRNRDSRRDEDYGRHLEAIMVQRRFSDLLLTLEAIMREEGLDRWALHPLGQGLDLAPLLGLEPRSLVLVHAIHHHQDFFGYLAHRATPRHLSLSEVLRHGVSLSLGAEHRQARERSPGAFMQEELNQYRHRGIAAETLFSHLAWGLMEVDHHLFIRYANPASLAYLPGLESQARGGKLLNLIHPDDREGVLALVQQASDSPVTGTVRFREAEGSRLTLWAVEALLAGQGHSLAEQVGFQGFPGGFRILILPMATVEQGLHRPPPLLFRHHHFSPQEKRVLTHVLRGDSNSDISRALGISPGTVRVHLHAMYAKTGCTSRAELIRLLRHYQGT